MPKGPRSERGIVGTGAMSKYRKEYDDRAREYSFLSARNNDLAVLFGVSDSTIENWKRDHPSFKAALIEGQELADLRVVRALHKRALGMDLVVTRDESGTGPNGPFNKTVRTVTGVPPDTAAALGWLRHRQRWSVEDPASDGPIRVIVEGGLPDAKEDSPPVPPSTTDA